MPRRGSIDDMNMANTFTKSRKIPTNRISSNCHGDQVEYQIDMIRIQFLPEPFKISDIIDDVAFGTLQRLKQTAKPQLGRMCRNFIQGLKGVVPCAFAALALITPSRCQEEVFGTQFGAQIGCSQEAFNTLFTISVVT